MPDPVSVVAENEKPFHCCMDHFDRMPEHAEKAHRLVRASLQGAAVGSTLAFQPALGVILALLLRPQPAERSTWGCAAGLGAAFVQASLHLTSHHAPFCAFVQLLCVYHTLEFSMTARFHPSSLSSDSFLLNQSVEYGIAMGCAAVEYWFAPWGVRSPLLAMLGLLLCVVGQALRTAAMLQAGHNFTHLIATTKEDKHILVTTGMYSLVRHPGYCGWFWWSCGSQLLLGNPLSLVGFAIVSWRFFRSRIQFEEATLYCFFGAEYLRYASRVGTGIPFLPGGP